MALSFSSQLTALPYRIRNAKSFPTRTSHLDRKHVVFGKVIKGLGVVRSIEHVTINDNGHLAQDVVITDCRGSLNGADDGVVNFFKDSERYPDWAVVLDENPTKLSWWITAVDFIKAFVNEHFKQVYNMAFRKYHKALSYLDVCWEKEEASEEPRELCSEKETPMGCVERHMHEICVKKGNELSSTQMIWTDKDGLLLKPLGKLSFKVALCNSDDQKILVIDPYYTPASELTIMELPNVQALQTMGIISFDTLVGADPRMIEIATDRTYPFGNHMKEFLNSLPPKVEMNI
ncbi:hypothetical protein Ancab_029761 [Ancistrocladus abbreviatus]